MRSKLITFKLKPHELPLRICLQVNEYFPVDKKYFESLNKKRVNYRWIFSFEKDICKQKGNILFLSPFFDPINGVYYASDFKTTQAINSAHYHEIFFLLKSKIEIIKSCHSAYSSVRSHFYFKIDLVFTTIIKRNVQNPVPKRQKFYSIVKKPQKEIILQIVFSSKKGRLKNE